jgi:hypothetical protein
MEVLDGEVSSAAASPRRPMQKRVLLAAKICQTRGNNPTPK